MSKKTKKEPKVIRNFLRIIDRSTNTLIHACECPDKEYADRMAKVLFCILKYKFEDKDISLTVVSKKDINKPLNTAPRVIPSKEDLTAPKIQQVDATTDKQMLKNKILDKILDEVVDEFSKRIAIYNIKENQNKK